MAKTKRPFIFGTFITSGIAVVLSCLSLGTQEWITSYVQFKNVSGESTVQYGLFFGTYNRIVSIPVDHRISMICLFSENACAMLCENTVEEAEKSMEDTINGIYVQFNTNCPTIGRALRTNAMDHQILERVNTKSESELQFINAGLWLSTVIFLVVSVLFGFIAAAFGVLNTVTSPIEIYFNVFGLNIYNSIACVCAVLPVIFWGALFDTTLKNNVAILETITADATSDGKSSLGYSYWLNFISFVLYGCSIGLLAARQYLINREPRTDLTTTNNDTDIILY